MLWQHVMAWADVMQPWEEQMGLFVGACVFLPLKVHDNFGLIGNPTKLSFI